MARSKEQIKYPEAILRIIEIYELPGNKLKITAIIWILNELKEECRQNQGEKFTSKLEYQEKVRNYEEET